ncbi:MAG: glycosyltransferase family protein, partial [Humibacter sp.]
MHRWSRRSPGSPPCPSGRMFEAAACGAPIISDWWEGLDTLFTPGEEIVIARSSEDVVR